MVEDSPAAALAEVFPVVSADVSRLIPIRKRVRCLAAFPAAAWADSVAVSA